MEKKYQVFISSTYYDLIEERKKVLDVLLMADCIPAGMEAFVATDAEQFDVIKKVIDLCDYYVLIIGKRYGSINEATGISYTEMEYDYAISKDIPVLVFALDDSVEVSDDKKETDLHKQVKLIDFRKKALSNRLASIWHTADELTGKLAIAIMKAKNEISRPGWQRGADYDEASLRREIMSLQNENKSLQEQLSQYEKNVDTIAQTDLAFENQPITIEYSYMSFENGENRTHTGKKKTDLKTIFVIIATEMMGVSLAETSIRATLIRHFNLQNINLALKDHQFIKRILNQFKALSLMDSSWNSENKCLYWRLTQKGIIVRDDAILIKAPCEQ